MQVSTEILSMINEAALIVRGDRVEYANPAACKLFGSNCCGSPLARLLGNELASMQGSAYVTERVIRDKTYTVRITKKDGQRTVMLCPSEIAPLLVNDAFIVSMKNALMDISLAIELQRAKLGREALSSLKLNYYRMQRLVNNVSILRDIYSGKLMLRLSQFSLRDLCRRLVDTASAIVPDHELLLRCEEETVVQADSEMVMQILLNLISNCFTHAGNNSAVTISVHSTKAGIDVSVIDDGCGIGQEALGSVFERYKTSSELNEMADGAGLGLSVARGLAAAMGGTLLIESRPGKGTVARFSISKALSAAGLRNSVEFRSYSCEDVIIGLSNCIECEILDKL